VVDSTEFDGDPRDLERFRARIISRVLTLIESIDTTDVDYLVDILGDVLLHPAELNRSPLPVNRQTSRDVRPCDLAQDVEPA